MKKSSLIIISLFCLISCGQIAETVGSSDLAFIGDKDKVVNNDTLLVIRQEGKYGYINTKGEIVIEPQYDISFPFSDGLAIVTLDGKYGIINKKREFIVPFSENWVRSFSEGLTTKKVNNKAGVIDTTGKEVLTPTYSFIERFSNGRAIVSNDWKDEKGEDQEEVSIIDTKGKQIIPFGIYSSIFSFSEGLAVARRIEDGKEVYIDTTGKVVLEIEKGKNLRKFSEGLASVLLPQVSISSCKAHGYINKQGEIVISPVNLYEADEFNNGYAVAEQGLRCDAESNLSYHGGTYYYIDSTGFKSSTIQENFDRAYDFKYGYALVKKDGKSGLIDTEGNMVFDYGEIGYCKAIYPNIIQIGGFRKIGYIRPWGEVIWETQK